MDKKPTITYPEVQWSDPRPNRKHGEQRRKDRIARGRTIAEEAAAQGLLPSELKEMERGCNPREGLTSTHGAEPLRGALLNWAACHQLTGDQFFVTSSLNWALETLRYWPPLADTVVFPLDPGLVIPRPHVPAWMASLQTWSEYLKSLEKDPLLMKYRADVESLIDPVPAKRGPGKKRGGSKDRHFHWLAGYQLCGWSKNAIASAVEINHAAFSRDIRRLAKQIGLTLRPAVNNDRHWTVEKIHAALVALTEPVT